MLNQAAELIEDVQLVRIMIIFEVLDSLTPSLVRVIRSRLRYSNDKQGPAIAKASSVTICQTSRVSSLDYCQKPMRDIQKTKVYRKC